MAERALGTAYVNLVPSIDGKLVKSEIGKIGNTVGGVGESAGKTFGGKFGAALKVGLAVGATAAIAGITKVVSDGVKSAAALSGSLREVVTLTGETGSQADATFEEFRDGVLGVSKELGIAQDVLVNGLYNALSAGVPRDNAFTFLEAAGKAAVAGVTDVNTSVDGLTTVINAFGLEASDVGAVSDSLFAAVQGGKTTFAELSASLFNVAPAAAAAGVSFQEINAGIATLTASGTPTSVATTQLRAALTGLQRPSAELDEIFQQLGFDNAQLAIESEGLGFALDAVKQASGGSNGQLQKLLGSVEAVAAANVLAGTGAEKFNEELERQANSIGATDKAFDEVDKSRSLERLQITFDNIKTTIGTAVLPLVEDFAKIISEDVAPAIQQFAEDFQNGQTPLNTFF
jgi:TP901 family phage tail tape measure protein